MSRLDELVDTLLWEGHQLYPYTPGAVKNATPTPFGIVYPPAYAAGSPHTHDRVRLQCIAVAGSEVAATAHFLHDGVAHRVELPARGAPVPFRTGAIDGRAILEVVPVGGFERVTVLVENTTAVAAGLTRSAALEASLLSTHVVVRCAPGGRFLSPIAPPEEAATAVMTCHSINIFPVLATEADDAVLGAAIMLPDHPQLAPESTGSLFDSTEIEEALLLHVLALSDGERAELEQADPAVREMIGRAVAATPEEIIRLHGRTTVRDPGADDVPGEPEVVVGGRRLARGQHVVLRPDRSHGQDVLLAGRSARIERILVDYDDHVHICVTVDDDPGQDLMREIGRFLYFKPTEVEVIGA